MLAIWVVMRMALCAGRFRAGAAILNGERVPRYGVGAVLMAAIVFAIETIATVGEL